MMFELSEDDEGVCWLLLSSLVVVLHNESLVLISAFELGGVITSTWFRFGDR